MSVALMAVAMPLAEKAPEWGGDCRDAVGEIAQLGLSFCWRATRSSSGRPARHGRRHAHLVVPGAGTLTAYAGPVDALIKERRAGAEGPRC